MADWDIMEGSQPTASGAGAGAAPRPTGTTNQSYAFPVPPLGQNRLVCQQTPTVSARTDLCNSTDPATAFGLGPWDQDYNLFGNSFDSTFLNEHINPTEDYDAIMAMFQPLPPTYSAGVTAYDAFYPVVPVLAPAPMTIPVPSNIPTGAHCNATQPTISTRIPCNVNGCTKTFCRPGDMRRHMRKHDASNSRYKCILDDCDAKFYRLDKLRDHLRQGHNITL